MSGIKITPWCTPVTHLTSFISKRDKSVCISLPCKKKTMFFSINIKFEKEDSISFETKVHKMGGGGGQHSRIPSWVAQSRPK